MGSAQLDRPMGGAGRQIPGRLALNAKLNLDPAKPQNGDALLEWAAKPETGTEPKTAARPQIEIMPFYIYWWSRYWSLERYGIQRCTAHLPITLLT